MNKKLETLLMTVIPLLIIIQMVRWGGIPDVGPIFWVGAVILLGTVAVFGGLCWWLFLSPLPATPRRAAPPLSEKIYPILLAALAAGLMVIIGVFWDETWHRTYGVGIVVEDFLWPPHKMLYLSLGILALIACTALFMAARAARGDFRVGFRAQPYMGLLGLLTAYLTFSLPSDAVWHVIYGLDITAWSLPHILLVSSFGLAMLALAAIFLSGRANLATFSLNDVLGAFAMSVSGVILLVLVTEYDSTPARVVDVTNNAAATIQARPEWLYPVVLLTLGILLAVIGVRLARRVGVVSLAAVGVAAFRLSAVALFGAWDKMGVASHLMLVVPMVVIDLWQLVEQRTARKSLILGAVAAGAAGLAVMLPVIATNFVYPRVTLPIGAAMVVWGLLFAVGAALVADRLGGWLAALEAGRLPSVAFPRLVWQTVVISAVALAIFLVLFFTARPPSA